MRVKQRLKGFKNICISCGNIIFNRNKNAKHCLACAETLRKEYRKDYYKDYNKKNGGQQNGVQNSNKQRRTKKSGCGS